MTTTLLSWVTDHPDATGFVIFVVTFVVFWVTDISVWRRP